MNNYSDIIKSAKQLNIKNEEEIIIFNSQIDKLIDDAKREAKEDCEKRLIKCQTELKQHQHEELKINPKSSKEKKDFHEKVTYKFCERCTFGNEPHAEKCHICEYEKFTYSNKFKNIEKWIKTRITKDERFFDQTTYNSAKDRIFLSSDTDRHIIQTMFNNEFRILNVEGDGTCLFRALSIDYFSEDSDNPEDKYNIVKNAIYEYLEKNWRKIPYQYEYSASIKEVVMKSRVNKEDYNKMSIDQRIARYISFMKSHNNEYASELEAMTYAHMMGKRIRIYQAIKQSGEISVDPMLTYPDDGREPDINLLLINNNHYAYLYKTDKLNKFRQKYLKYKMKYLQLKKLIKQ